VLALLENFFFTPFAGTSLPGMSLMQRENLDVSLMNF